MIKVTIVLKQTGSEFSQVKTEKYYIIQNGDAYKQLMKESQSEHRYTE